MYPINQLQYAMKRKVAITLNLQVPCSAHYTALQVNTNFSTMNPYCFRKANGKPFWAIANQHFALLVALSAKRTGGQRQYHDTCYVRSYRGWRKGMSRDKAISSSEEIKPVSLSIVELFLAEGISQLIVQLVSQSASRNFR